MQTHRPERRHRLSDRRETPTPQADELLVGHLATITLHLERVVYGLAVIAALLSALVALKVYELFL